jgi:hypothetical protein
MEPKFTIYHAIIRGIKEYDDSSYYLGSTVSLKDHIAECIEKGYCVYNDTILSLTAAGEMLYSTEILPYNLSESRWYVWRVKGKQ